MFSSEPASLCALALNEGGEPLFHPKKEVSLPVLYSFSLRRSMKCRRMRLRTKGLIVPNVAKSDVCDKLGTGSRPIRLTDLAGGGGGGLFIR